MRSLGHDLYRFGLRSDTGFTPGWDLLAFLDGNISTNGQDDPVLHVEVFHLSWWDTLVAPIKYTSYLSFATVKTALAKHRLELERVGPPRSTSNLVALEAELNKPAYTWHSESAAKLDNPCTRCRLYRAVSLGVMDKLRDVHNYAHACETANQAETELAMRRASGFNELYEVATRKEAESGSVDRSNPFGSETPVGSMGKKGKKGKGKTTEIAEDVRRHAEILLKESLGRPETKWTWGVNLTSQDLQTMERGADRGYQIPHSGYDADLVLGKMKGDDSLPPNPNEINSDFEANSGFESLALDFPDIRSLSPTEFPPAFLFPPLHHTAGCELDSEPNAELVEGLLRRKAKKARAKTTLMSQANIVQPEPLFLDDSSRTRSSWLGRPPKSYVSPPTPRDKGHEDIISDCGLIYIPSDCSSPRTPQKDLPGPRADSLSPIPESDPEHDVSIDDIYVPFNTSSPLNQDEPMELCDDSPGLIPIGELGLSDEPDSADSDLDLLAPLTVVIPDDLDCEDTQIEYNSNLSQGNAEDNRNIVPLTVYMSESDSESEEVSDYRYPEQFSSHSTSIPQLDPTTHRYTAASFTDVPDEWLD